VATVLELIENRVIYTFVSKPWNDDELRLTVQRALEYQATQQEVRRLEETLEQVNQQLAQLRGEDRQRGDES
jgi:DNA-binding NtrC family response regulator